MAKNGSTWKTLDLFCGCGGLTQGFEIASKDGLGKFDCVGSIDNWRGACEAFSLNHAVAATCAEVTTASVAAVLERTGDVDVVVGGPPCQGFSTSGKRALDDPRNALVRAFFDAVALAKPQAFLMENVSGFTTFQGGAIMREVFELTADLGYRPHAGIVLSSLVGVPQRRRRFILVGLRTGTFLFPGLSARDAAEQGDLFDLAPAEAASGLIVNQRVADEVSPLSFDDATSDLPEIDAGERTDSYAGAPRNAFQAWCRRGADEELCDHVAGRHKAYFVEMMRHVPPGRSAMDPEIRATMPEELRPRTGFPNSYARIRGDEPAPTITRNFTTPSSANCIHPRRHRALTLREGARCQSFPDRFRFAGGHGARRLMIGNAIPPLLGAALGTQLLHALNGRGTNDRALKRPQEAMS